MQEALGFHPQHDKNRTEQSQTKKQRVSDTNRDERGKHGIFCLVAYVVKILKNIKFYSNDSLSYVKLRLVEFFEN